MSIRKKLLGALLLLALVSALGSVWIFRGAQVDQVVLGTVSSRFENSVVRSGELAVLIKDLQINVVQVQQFLTDVSATRGLDGLDDGYTAAAENAAEFEKNIVAAKKLAKLMALDDVTDALESAAKAFPSFYASGKKMADAYVKSGPTEGNKLMGQFDKDSAALGDAMDKLAELSHNVLTGSVAEIKTSLLQVSDKARTSLIVTATIGTLTVAACLMIAWLIQLNVLNPLSLITTSMGQLADGRLEIHITGQNRPDEIGAMARALGTFKDGLLEAQTLRSMQDEQKAKAEKERRDTMKALADTFEAAVGSVAQAVATAASQLRTAAQSMSAHAQTSTEQSKAAVYASMQMKHDVEGVSEAAGQLSAAVQEISRQITTATQMAGMALTAANTTSTQVDQLSKAAHQISAVTQTINDIANQTNLLALNATIEAARAGEAGKGFAVVAGEVKTLSNQTASATGSISSEIANIQDITQGCVEAIKGIGQKISDLNSVSSTIAAAVEEQTASTQEISRNVNAAANGTASVLESIDQVSKASEMTGSAARDVLAASEQLSHQAAELSSQMAKFLNKIRAG